MRLAISVFGLDLLSVELTTDEVADEDLARDLSGGELASTRVGFELPTQAPDWTEVPER